MRIVIVTPVPRGSRQGNRITALRWQRLLRGLGHRCTVTEAYRGQPADLLVALHARRSHASVVSFALRFPGRPIVVALTGTDIYGSRPIGRAAQASLEAADRLIALQPLAAQRLPPRLRGKVRVILQSMAPSARGRRRRPGAGNLFPVCVVAHLRTVKDPLRAALAVRRLPARSGIRVEHVGRAMTAAWERRARREMARNPRYRWRGEVSRAAALGLMAASLLLVLPSRSEGGANVLSEAAGLGVPVLASRVAGNVGLLGRAYRGYFAAGSTLALRRLLLRAERDPSFLAALRRDMAALARAVAPQREREAWRRLLKECERPRRRRI
jgi:putative glycosyltransferase (TIGR04348 family)